MIRNSDIHRLRGLFAKRLIATMDMLKKTVGTVADLGFGPQIAPSHRSFGYMSYEQFTWQTPFILLD